MKKILLGILMMLVSQTTVLAEKDVTITVSSDGATKAEAISNALRSAIEQTYGAFVSSNTTILNDKLVNDEIVSLSRGNIKKYKIIAEEALSSDRYFVILSAVVNMENLVSYVHGSTDEVEVDFDAFDANIRMAEMNKEAEKKIMESVITQIQSMDNLWDYSIQLDEPKVAPEKYKKVYGGEYLITGTVSVRYNQNTCNAIDLLIDMFDAIRIDEPEITMLNSIYEPTLKSKACLKCLYFTIIIFDLCRYLEYFSYLCTINQTE